jgi:hypothetical protein
MGRARETALAKSGQLDQWAAYASACLALGLALGRGELLAGGYRAGYDLGHDTGLGARQDTRALVRGIIDGYSAGCAARHRLVAELLDQEAAPCNHGADTRPQAPQSTGTPNGARTPSTSPPGSANPTLTACAETGSNGSTASAATAASGR